MTFMRKAAEMHHLTEATVESEADGYTGNQSAF